MDIEQKIKTKLLSRGFSKETLLNNRGLIGATIDETILEIVNKIGNVSNQRELLLAFTKHQRDWSNTNLTKEMHEKEVEHFLKSIAK